MRLPTFLVASLALLLTAFQAAAQPYMSDPEYLAQDMVRRLSIAPLIEQERRTGRVPANFAEAFRALNDGSIEYAQLYADETGQGRTLRRNAERGSAAVLAARTLPDWLAGYPEPIRVVEDIRRDSAGENSFAIDGRIAGTLTLLRRTMLRESRQRGDRDWPPGGNRLYWLYEIYIEDIRNRVKPAVDRSSNECRWYTRLVRRCDHQRYQSAFASYDSGAQRARELASRYFPEARRDRFVEVALPDATTEERLGWDPDRVRARGGTGSNPFDWVEIGLAAALALLSGLGLFLWLWRLNKGPGTSDIFGSADFAKVRLKIDDPSALFQGVFLGRSWLPGFFFRKAPTAPIVTSPGSHTLIVAYTGTGKGTCVVQPTLLLYRSSMFVIDPKGELAAITARHRRDQLGHTVHIINPWGVEADRFARFGFTPAKLNPLAALKRDDENVVAHARTIAEAICLMGSDKDPIWQASATSLITALLLWVTDQPGETQTLDRISDLISGGENLADIRKDLLPRMAASSSFRGAMRKQVGPLTQLSDDTWSGVIFQASQSLQFAADPRIHDVTESSSFPLSSIVNGKTTIYFVIPEEQMKAQAVWLRLMISSVTQTYKRERPAKHNVRGMFLMDEFAQMGRVDGLVKDIAIMRGAGLDYTLVVQDYSQIRAEYGESADTLIANCGWKWFCNVNDLGTAEHLSKALGKMTVQTVSQTVAEGDRGTTKNYGETGRSLLFPDEILNLGKSAAFAFNPQDKPHYLKPVDYRQLEQYLDIFAKAQKFTFPRFAYDPSPDHEHQQQQQQQQGGGGRSEDARPGAMTRERALRLLRLKEGATAAEVTAAYKRMMKTAHPDGGGADEFAQLLNEARSVLLGRA